MLEARQGPPTFTIIVALLCSLLAGCLSPRTLPATPRPAQSAAVQTLEPLPTSSPLPRPTRTPKPTVPTAIPTSTPVPLPLTPPPAGLVYSARDTIWQVDAKGQSIELATRPAKANFYGLSPDGTQAFYQADGDLWIADLRFGQARNLTNTPGRMECCAQWWPARPDEIIFGSQPMNAAESGIVGELSVIHPDGTDYRVLVPESESWGEFAPSPDGRSIAYDQNLAPWLYRWDEGPEPLDMSTYGLETVSAASPSWSPDGSQLAWMVTIEDGYTMATAVLDLESHTGQTFLASPKPAQDGWLAAPEWSPDGQWLATAWYSPTHGAAVLQVETAETHTVPRAYEMLWAPDGRSLAFRLGSDWATSPTVLMQIETWQMEQVDLPEGARVIGWATPPSPELAQNVEKTGQLAQGAEVLSRGEWPISFGSGQELAMKINYPGEEVRTITVPGTIQDIWSSLDYVYVAVEGKGLWAVEPGKQVQFEAGPPDQPLYPRALFIENHCQHVSCPAGSGQIYAYVASPQEGFYMIDITDPHQPNVAGVYDEREITALVVDHGYAYVIQGGAELQVLDVADPKTLHRAASVAVPGAVDVALFEAKAYVADRWGGITIVDVADPTSPVLLGGKYELPADFPQGEARRIAVDEGPWSNAGPRFAYLAMGEAGVRIVDVTNPRAPRAAGFFDTDGAAAGFRLWSDSPYVAAGEEGLLTLRFVPAPTATQFGPFSLQHLVSSHLPLAFPTVQIPTWLQVSQGGEKELLEEVASAYAPLLQEQEDWRKTQGYGEQVEDRATAFLEKYPGGDGAIPALMMLGNVHSCLNYTDTGQPTLGREYEQVLALLLQRHPERISTILDDLIDLGLPISQVVSAQVNGRQVLFFAFQFSPLHGEPNGRIYTLVQQPDDSWSFFPLPTRFSGNIRHGAQVQTIADINGDGQDEVVVRLDHAFADGTGLNVQVFSWREGAWHNQIGWAGAFEGDYWLEDPDGDGVQDIVLRSRMSGGGPFRPFIYFFQWDPSSGTYTDTLPVAPQICGYHAYAEADRLFHQDDKAGADTWYQEAAQRLRAELAVAGSPCLEHFTSNTIWDMIEVAEQPDHGR